ncbi:MAG: dTMP kinase [Bifidobacteriaceae bacterium]|jgi:dTMP kinase|nr:dTMP kinase [Bifidobacteriaceae bacterium]
MDSPTLASPLTGRFVAFEGGDGAGKSTQLELLAAALRAQGLVDATGRPGLVVTREPGGTALGVGIRDLLLHGGAVDAVAEALLYAADRAQHVATVVRPALARGALVLADRCLDSSLAYQIEGRQLAEELVRAVNAPATGGLTPDLTILLDVGQDVAATRLAESERAADRLERAGGDFHRRVNQRYRDLAAEAPERYAVVAAAGPVAEVQARVRAAFDRHAAAWGRTAR